MSVAQRVFRQAKELTDLETLAKLISDTSAISKAAEVARKEAKLTQDVIDEVEEAKVLLANRDTLVAALDKREFDLSEAEKKHSKNVADFADHVESQKTDLAKKDKELSDQSIALKQQKEALVSEYSELKEELKKSNAQMLQAIADANAREQQAQKAIESAENLSESLGATLKEKREKVASLAKIASEI
jgi:hypothetical protein